MRHRVPFTKMHGLGNDVVIINSIKNTFDPALFSIPQLADRHVGIGFDQLLVIEPSQEADFFCRIYNADGSEAEQCGNGLRCVARFLHEQGLCKTSALKIATKAGVFPALIKDYEHIAVTMGIPEIKDHFVMDKFSISAISLGNPHAIIQVEAIETAPLPILSAMIAEHAFFAEGANVGLMQVLSPHHIRLRTHERGTGETLACGSNACAAVVAGIKAGCLQSPVTVALQKGKLEIHWPNEQAAVEMTGPASLVFWGEIP